MPYVVKNQSGQWLRSKRGVYREWVDNLDRASMWEKLGHAKAAASQAQLSSGKSLETEIQEVRLMLWGSPIAHRRVK